MNPNIQKLEALLSQVATKEEVEALLHPVKELSSKRRYGLVWEEPESGAYASEDADTVLKKHYPFLKEDMKKALIKEREKETNLLIEGDNLHALQAMQYTHKGKVDVIYIDPPYNTGNQDFVYNDRFVDKEDSWRHSSWLSFMNKRLRLARELMSDEGVIFISIDDNEMAQLKLLCDQVFGEENHLFTTTRKTKSMTGDDGSGLNIQHDFILAYAKIKRISKLMGEEKSFSEYKNPDNDPNGDWVTADPTAKSGSKSTSFPIVNPHTGKIDYPSSGRYWAFSKATLDKYVENGRIVFKKKHPKNQRGFYFKRYKETLDNVRNPLNTLFWNQNEYLNSEGTKDLRNIIGDVNFSYPKPVEFVKSIVRSHPSPNALVLDFFAGSGTTGHAVMELNKEDGGNRQFILCTNNEISSDKETDFLVEQGHVTAPPKSKRGKAYKEWKDTVDAFKASDEGIAVMDTDTYKDLGIARAVTYERLKRVINGYTTPKGKEVEGIPNNLRYFTVSLKEDMQDEELNSYKLIKDTVDLIRLKENVFTQVNTQTVDEAPVVTLQDKDKSILIVLDTDVYDEQIGEILKLYPEDGRERVLYTSYTHYPYTNIRFEELPKEILRTLKAHTDKA